VISEWWIGKNVKGSGRGLIRYHPSIFLEVLSKTTKTLSQDSRSSDRELNPGPPEYEAAMITTRPRRSVKGYGRRRSCHMSRSRVKYWHSCEETEVQKPQWWQSISCRHSKPILTENTLVCLSCSVVSVFISTFGHVTTILDNGRIHCNCEPCNSVSIVSGYGLDDRAIEVRSPAEAKGFFL
jgi:hypothetical protein